MIDFVEISQERVYKFKASLDSPEISRYIKTLYVAISQDDKVVCAYDSSVLSDAYQCILIHCKSLLAVTNWYNWYQVEFINHNGLNLGRIIGNDCTISINWEGSYSNQVMKLCHRDKEIYSCKSPFENHMQGVWNAYCKTLEEGRGEMTALKSLLAQKEERIHELEEQVNLYKNTLARIKDCVKELGGE